MEEYIRKTFENEVHLMMRLPIAIDSRQKTKDPNQIEPKLQVIVNHGANFSLILTFDFSTVCTS